MSNKARSPIPSAPSTVLGPSPASNGRVSLPSPDHGGFLLEINDLNPQVQSSIGLKEPTVDDLDEVPKTSVEHLQNH